jgi:hypothetical protein
MAEVVEIWCKSETYPIAQGTYTLHDGIEVTVKRSRSGKFYATCLGKYTPGLIWKLRFELENKLAKRKI